MPSNTHLQSLLFATSNSHKVEEVQSILGPQIQVRSLPDIGCTIDIPETADTLEGNAEIKARFVYDNYGLNCFAEDAGLEIDCLDGAPGVFTARFAGPEKSATANMAKVLRLMSNQDDRRAQFRTIFALLIDGELQLFEGIVRGKISLKISGSDGFGYDPIFIPDGYTNTFAELDTSIKHRISHRSIALYKMLQYLENH